VQLVSKISNLCDHNPPTLQTDGRHEKHERGCCFDLHPSPMNPFQSISRFLSADKNHRSFDMFVGQFLSADKNRPILSADFYRSSDCGLKDFKFGGYIYRANPNIKLWRKGTVGISRNCPNFWGTPYYLRNG